MYTLLRVRATRSEAFNRRRKSRINQKEKQLELIKKKNKSKRR